MNNDEKILDLFLNKRVKLEHKGKIICGTLTFLGLNEFFPSWNIQATIDGMPIKNVDITKIKLIENERR